MNTTTNTRGVSEVDVLAVEFVQEGDFAAINAARDWCAERGVSVGAMQGPSPMGLLAGDYCIAKWRNLSPEERAELDGSITGDKRNGPVVLRIKRTALRNAGVKS